MGYKTIQMPSIKQTAKADSIQKRFSPIAFFILVLLTLLGFILAFYSLLWLLSPRIDFNLSLMLSSSFPAFFLGLSFFPLLKQLHKLFFTRKERLPNIINELDLYPEISKSLRSHNLSGHLIGAYQLEEIIGRGGMAEVYRAIGHDTIVAIKLLYPHHIYDEEFLERFYREGEFGLGINNPHIAAVYEIGLYGEMPYIVMEYVEGEDLSQIISRADGYTYADIVLWMSDICKALDMAHKQGYVHRDIKPGNIMIRPNGEAVLMDFGLAKFHHATNRITDASIGTLGYMAPEQILASQDIDYLADIYSLGVVCYELLTGVLPFDGNTGQILYAHINHERPDPRNIDPDIPAHMAKAVIKAMAINNSERFQSAGELAEALIN
jgi:serine/threonine protein kinase